MSKRVAFVITYFDAFHKYAIKEVINIDESLDETKLCPSISLIECEGNGNFFVDSLIKSDPIFVRHIFPVSEILSLTGLTEDQCKQAILKKTTTCTTIPSGQLFSVQCREISSEKVFSSKDIEVMVGSYYEKLGAIPDFSDYKISNKANIVISILINSSSCYIGSSNASDNLNSHSNEYRVLSRKEKVISRSENKLKEAICKFKIEVSGKGYVLDLGAAPGGWTKVLADYGFRVIAVDPGVLHESLHHLPNVTHFQKRIEDLEVNYLFNLITNDMNVEPQITARIMCSLSEKLCNQGLAIVTLKMPFANVIRSLQESIEILKKSYEIISVKSLFHNRREVTVLLRKNS